ncbi:hypothetical protein CL618_00015 [archaeon]|nr:hypothetical protein [archaeon]|tara:strand:+ start:1187 stop:1675 length:489 start_codon:yes stop_codon:yes gene_type:complete
MYNLLFDSDALIKLTHSEALIKVCVSFRCIITDDVKREVVDEGKKRFYPDAEIIEKLIEDNLLKIKNPKKKVEIKKNLGSGELSILSLNKEIKNHLIISDDKEFIKELEKEDIDFLIPGDLIILLKKMRKINQKEAKNYIEKMKVFIREEDYKKFKKELEGK